MAFRTATPQSQRNGSRIGVLSTGSKTDPESQAYVKALQEGLRELGWKEGNNIHIDYRYGDWDTARLPRLAKELVALRPNVLVAAASPSLIALRQQTLSIPIVFVQVADPVSQGFVANLARPNGNITGFTNFDTSIAEKWVQALKQCAPKLNRAAVLFDPGNPTWTNYVRAIEASSSNEGIALTPVAARNDADLTEAIVSFAKAPNGGLLVLPSPITLGSRELIVSLAAKYRLPAIYPYRAFTKLGGLISYGTNVPDMYHRAASYVDRILKGVKPADLPVQQPTKFELVINMGSARALGLMIPKELLVRADEVIE